jgi:iron complex outermembrane receptor protein
VEISGAFLMRICKSSLLATTVIAGLAILTPSLAYAQATPQQQPAAGQQEEDEEQDSGRVARLDEVVVTGSRIRRSEFNSTQPVQIITSEEATLEGLVDTSEILQGSTTAATSGQINNYFTGFVTVGGPGVNTLSLRGLGANRTLILLNGRRAGPAGARGQVGPTDLNVIPASMIERVEILTDGASSIYGSDAIAGVVNIITRQNLDGGAFTLHANQPFKSGGEEYSASISQGWTFDRGYLSASADYYERKPLLFGDRDYFCPQQYLFTDEARTQRADPISPDTGTYVCNSAGAELVSLYFAGGAQGASDYAPDSAAVAGGGPLGCDMNGWRHVRVFMIGHGARCRLPAQQASAPWQAPTAAAYNDLLREYAGRSGIATHSDRYASRTAVSPVTRKSVVLTGGYDLTPTTEIYGELLLNRRESQQETWRQWWGVISAAHPRNPFPASMFDPLLGVNLPITHVEPTLLLNSRNEQRVDYVRGLAGIRGSLDIGRGWDWDLVAQYSRSDAQYGGTFIYNDRVRAASAASGCNVALLRTATSCPAGGVDWFSPAVVGDGQLRAEDAAFLLGYEFGNTVYTHFYIEGVASGELFDLPAGPVGAAFGFQHRHEKIDDQPGQQERTGNYWGSSSAVATVGEDTIRELFAEFEIPLLRDMPFVNRLSVNLSGRHSQYDTYGAQTTYKAGLNWAVTPAWRIRASTGNSFRAPALYELFLGNLTNFGFGQASDPCRNWSNSTNERIRANCAAGRPGEGPLPGTFPVQPTSSAEVTVGGGLGVLEAETADTHSIGVIWTPSFIDLNIALDYFSVEVFDQVASFGAANIVAGCYTSENFPDEPLCNLFTRAPATDPSRAYEILTINDSYVNINRQFNEGLDLTARYRRDFGFGDLTLNARASYILNWESQLRTASTPTIVMDRIGNPEWVANVNARFDRNDWTFFWAANFVPSVSNQRFYTAETVTYFNEPAWTVREVDFYQTHDLSVRRVFDKWTFQLGVQNVFDAVPNEISAPSNANRTGNIPLSSQYDFIGRRGFFSVSRRW